MKILVLILALLFSAPTYANQACVELSVVAQTVESAHQSGIPKLAVQTAMKMSGIKTKTMKAFVSALVVEAYSDERVANTDKKKVVENFSYRIFQDCEKLMKVHDNIK